MSTTVSPLVNLNSVAPLRTRRFTVDDYHRMAKAGILTPQDRVELINGWIVSKMTLNPPHAICLSKLDRRFGQMIPEECAVRCQLPITLGDDSEPEPDLVVATGKDDDYGQSHPGPQQVLLVIEVADSSLDIDRHEKLMLYALHGLSEYWIVNLVDRQIEVYTDPVSTPQPTYRKRSIYLADDQIPVVLAGKPLAQLLVKHFLPEAASA
ncbi:MAG: Uma2 family endonuclease [Gemmataceae bacterium]